jgi:prephenate dehydratase
VKNDTSGESAAIASKLAGELNGLDVLAQNIEDRTDNTTRFFVLRKGLKEDDIDKATPQNAGDQYKSFVRFTVDHKSPGALVDVLESFKRFKVNLTSINSRPSRVRPFHYIFFVEFEGSKFYDELDVVKAVLESIDKTAHEWRWLGSWKDQLKRLE